MNRRMLLAACFLPAVLLVACEKTVTLDNFNTVAVGMTLDQVENMLGKGELQVIQGGSISAAGVLGGASQSSQETYTWREGNKEISVTMKDGKVISKSHAGL